MADNIVVNPGTSTVGTVATDDVSGTHFQRIKLDIGALNASTPFTADTGITVGTLGLGSVVVTSLPTSGTVVRVGNVGTLELGSVTVTALPTSGTIVRVGNVGTVELGSVVVTSLPSGGTILRVGNVGTVELGSVTVNAALPTGANNIGDVDIATGTVTQVSNVATGTIAALASGTITGGTVQNLVSGTINSGTVVNNGGTVIADNIQFRHADEFATVISSGTSTLGTIKAAVAGSVIYITDLIVSAGTATNVEIASGGTSTPIVGTLHFASNGGIAAPSFKVYPRTASGSALVYKQSTNGPLTLTVNGYVD